MEAETQVDEEPSKQPRWRLAMASSQMLEVKDTPSLQFVCTVLAEELAGAVVDRDEAVGTWRNRRAAMPKLVVYLGGAEGPLGALCAELFKSLGIAFNLSPGAVETYGLGNGGNLVVVDLGRIEGTDQRVSAVEAVQSGLAVVLHGSSIDAPVPDLAIDVSVKPRRKSTRRSPYLMDLFIQDRGLAPLTTQLLPKYWSIHPAYEVLRRACAGKAA